MRYASLWLIIPALAAAGCHDKQQEAPRVPPAPVAMPKQEAALPPTDTPAPVSDSPATGTPAPVPAALMPVQEGIEAFKVKFGRLPVSVQEMVDKKILTQLPPLPSNKMYVVDHETGQVRVTGNP